MKTAPTQVYRIKDDAEKVGHCRSTLSDAPGEVGRRHCVFVEEGGEAKARARFTGARFHRVIDRFRWVIGLVANAVVRPALRLPFLGYEEGGL